MSDSGGKACFCNTWCIPCSPVLYSLVVLPSSSMTVSFLNQQCLVWLNFATYLLCSVAQLGLTLCDPIDCSTPGLPVCHQLLDLTQTHDHWVGDAIQSSHPLSCPSLPTFNLSQHQGLFKWISSSQQVAKVLEFQLQHQSFQWIFKTDFL